MVTEGDWTMDDKHKMQYPDILQNCTLETYTILLTVTTINLT